MKIAMFSAKAYDRESFEKSNPAFGHEIRYLEARLIPQNAPLAAGFPAVCVFVNDLVNAEVLDILHAGGTGMIALRCAGYNNVDLRRAHELGMCVARVPAYSPYAVAEHTVGLMLALNRKFHRAHARVREGNFALDGLMGFDMRGRTVGIVGTGKIGIVVAEILTGFGCKLLAYDPGRNPEFEKLGGRYATIDELLADSDIITLHCPLMPETRHMIDWKAIEKMKRGVMLINTSRGALVETRAAIAGLKLGQIGALGLDVYEEEADLFFEDLSNQVIQDDTFARLQTFPNVLITGHQAFFTCDALTNIADTTLANVHAFETENACRNSVFPANAGDGKKSHRAK